MTPQRGARSPAQEGAYLDIGPDQALALAEATGRSLVVADGKGRAFERPRLGQHLAGWAQEAARPDPAGQGAGGEQPASPPPAGRRLGFSPPADGGHSAGQLESSAVQAMAAGFAMGLRAATGRAGSASRTPPPPPPANAAQTAIQGPEEQLPAWLRLL